MISTDSVESVFLADLDKDASDHTTRKIYADWLEEQGRVGEAEVERWIASREVVKRNRQGFYSFTDDIPNSFCEIADLLVTRCPIHSYDVDIAELFYPLQRVARHLYREGKWKPS